MSASILKPIRTDGNERVLLVETFTASSGSTNDLATYKGVGITSVNNISTGLYEVELDDRYSQLIGVNSLQLGSSTATGVYGWTVKPDPTSYTYSTASGQYFYIRTYNASDALADLVTGDYITITVTVAKSSVTT